MRFLSVCDRVFKKRIGAVQYPPPPRHGNILSRGTLLKDDKNQLSLTGPCDGIVLQTELDDKLQRSTDDGPVYQLITCFDDRYAVAKFSKSGVQEKVPEGTTTTHVQRPFFWDCPGEPVPER